MLLDLVFWLALVPVLGGSVFGVLAAGACLRFLRELPRRGSATAPVTMLKPVYGLEEGLLERLRSACRQDHPAFEVVFCVQNPDDPALPLVRQVVAEFGPDRAVLALHDCAIGPNGKVNNLLGGLALARHDLLVISDSDVVLRPDYLSAITASFDDPAVGCVNTLFKVSAARRWYEKLELLTINADFIPSVVFAWLTGASDFCLGPSVAIRRDVLARIGGLEALSEYLAEDYEIGRRVPRSGSRFLLIPYIVDAEIELSGVPAWWRHQIYWDQNTRVAQPSGFLLTVLTRAVPFALLAAAITGFSATGLTVLAAGLLIRLLTAAIALAALGDREGLRCLHLLPLRDLIGLVTWALAFTDRTVTWRGVDYVLTGGGKMVVKSAPVE